MRSISQPWRPPLRRTTPVPPSLRTLISVSGGSAGSRASASPAGKPAVCTTYKECLAGHQGGNGH